MRSKPVIFFIVTAILGFMSLILIAMEAWMFILVFIGVIVSVFLSFRIKMDDNDGD